MKKFLFLLVFTFLYADDPKICLNMIVKNEKEVICRCLASVKPLIDYWVIVDTGSKDGTQEIIKEFMKDIPGELHERPWVNFAHNRNEALSLAKTKGDYTLFIDADDILTYSPDFVKPKLNKDGYLIQIKYNEMLYDRTQLIKNTMDWRWEGVVHEVIVSPYAYTSDHLEGVTMVIIGGGDRSHNPQKFKNDAKLLEAAIKKDPKNGRNVFYLAQSYRDAQEPKKSLKAYEKRVAMGGWDQEVFWSLYQIAQIKQTLKASDEEIVNAYFKAFHYRPTRAEPLYHLSTFYRLKENYLMGYLLSQFALSIKLPADVLFVESWIYNYGLLLEYSICSYWIGRYEESYAACNELLSKPLPSHIKECVERNLKFTVDKLPVKKAI